MLIIALFLLIVWALGMAPELEETFPFGLVTDLGSEPLTG